MIALYRGVLPTLSLLVGVLIGGEAIASLKPATPETFSEVLSTAQPGDILELEPGVYPPLFLGGGTAGKPLTFRSRDLGHPAVFTQIKLEGAEYIVFENIVCDYRVAPGQDLYAYAPFLVVGSGNIVFRGVLFDGDLIADQSNPDRGYGAAVGLGFQGSHHLTIENATFRTFYRGATFAQVQDVVLKNNDFYDIHSDGTDFAEAQRVTIEGNYFHDFVRPPQSTAHPDMIQFWTASTGSPSTDIYILNNIINTGDNDWTQSIFMRNEMVDSQGAGIEMFYRNIEIAGNVIINAHLHGITVGETDGLVIRNNTLFQGFTTKVPLGSGDRVAFPTIQIAQSSLNVTVSNNISATIDGPPQKTWAVSDNLFIVGAGYPRALQYQAILNMEAKPQPSKGTKNGLEPYVYRLDGPADGVKFGAPLLRADAVAKALVGKGAPPELLAARPIDRYNTGIFDGVVRGSSRVAVEKIAGTANRFHLRAITPKSDSEMSAVWRLKNGAEAKGPAIELDLVPGRNEVSVDFMDGPRDIIEIDIPDPHMWGFSEGKLSATGKAGSLSLPFVTLKDAGPVLLVKNGSAAAGFSWGDVITAPVNATSFRMDFLIRTAQDQAAPVGGVVVEIPGVLGVSVTNIGALSAWVSPIGAQKPLQMRSAPLRLHDGKWHLITLLYDAAVDTKDKSGVLLLVDERPVAHQFAQGALQITPGNRLNFGGKDAQESFNGFMSKFDILAISGKVESAKSGPTLRPLL